jgi:hypothetical protein
MSRVAFTHNGSETGQGLKDRGIGVRLPATANILPFFTAFRYFLLLPPP